MQPLKLLYLLQEQFTYQKKNSYFLISEVSFFYHSVLTYITFYGSTSLIEKKAE